MSETKVADALDQATSRTRSLLEAALEGRELDVEGAALLLEATGPDLTALLCTADAVRAQQVGDEVSYVVNRNINFTNVCIKSCGFCAFARNHRSEKGYYLEPEEVVGRAVEARDLGASEVCLQAGLAPGMTGREYVDLCRAIKAAAPELHLHAFSPEEVKYGAALRGMSVRDYLAELCDAGLGSLPGTSAEVLDDDVRAVLSRDRLSTAEWVAIVKAAHGLGIPTTSTLMFGHLETSLHVARHLALLRGIQKETGGFTEFVPLSFVHQEAPLYQKGLMRGVRPGPSQDDVLRLFAVARLVLGAVIPNLQVSWVKQGVGTARVVLGCGANDVGGTLLNESISTSAGSAHGQFMSPRALRALICSAGKVPRERDTCYRTRRVFPEGADEDSALDRVTDAETRFGSYREVARDVKFRFVGRRVNAG